MKVLWIGPYRDGGGYSSASQDYILSLDSVSVNVVARPLKLNNHQVELPSRLLELEERSSQGADICILHALPHMMELNGKFKATIGLYASETSNFRKTCWADRLNLLSRIFVINNQMVEAARESGVTKPLSVIPHATNVEKFQRGYPTLPELKPCKERGEFLFYFVGEMIRRKNLQGLLQAFHGEFDPSEPVRLVIKTNKSGMSEPELQQHLRVFCSEIKRGMKIHSQERFYKEEVVITRRLSEQEMGSLHTSCDCFVLPSYGEAWAIPSFDAMGHGKTPIVSDNTGFRDYLDDQAGWMIPCQETPCFGVDDTFEELYTGHENWWVPSIVELRKAMREAYENHSLRQAKAAEGMGRVYDYSYEKIGEKLKEELSRWE